MTNVCHVYISQVRKRHEVTRYYNSQEEVDCLRRKKKCTICLTYPTCSGYPSSGTVVRYYNYYQGTIIQSSCSSSPSHPNSDIRTTLTTATPAATAAAARRRVRRGYWIKWYYVDQH